MTHELGHRMEDRYPEISVATKSFLRRRTAGLAPERYAKRELVTPDGFSDRYMGKDYAGILRTSGGEFTELRDRPFDGWMVCGENRHRWW